ncbi:LptF/LptG family permease [Thermodesulfobacteriota bacterium]
MKLTLFKYIIHEVWPTFLTSLLVFIFIILAARMMNISEWIINFGVPPVQVIKMILYLLPNILIFALPATILLAVLIAFIRLSSDNEILALKSSGISLYQMLPPILAISLTGYVMAMLLGVYGTPWGNRSFKNFIFKAAKESVDLNIKERVFCEPFDNITFYINSYSSKEKIMRDIFVVDGREPSMTDTIIAKKGKILLDTESRMITIHFVDGAIFTLEGDLETARNIEFSTYDLNLGLEDVLHAVSSRKKSPKEMNIQELKQSLTVNKKGEMAYNKTVVELMEKFSIPLAVFLMGLIGAPLGTHIKAGGRFPGIMISLVIFLIYYICLAGVRSICETGVLSPFFGPWLPVLFLLLFSVALLPAAANQRHVHFFDTIASKWRRIISQWYPK